MRKTELQRLFELSRKNTTGDITPSERNERKRLMRRAEMAAEETGDDLTVEAVRLRYIFAYKWDDVADEMCCISSDCIRKRCSRAMYKDASRANV